MRTVELHLNRAGFGDRLSEMRRWLDRHDCTPALFGTSTERPGTVLVHVEFREDANAEAFEHAFVDG
jgi:hypothetical protein